MKYLYFLLPAALLLLIVIPIIVLHFKKKSVIRKVNALSSAEKQTTLDTLAQTVGYSYDAAQDIFVARLDAPQKLFGYTSFYDLSAPYFNMIFDYETIYFDYNGRTWLVEMWKGQYGINAGCELGIYYADEIIPPEDYANTHFKAVEARDMPEIALELAQYSSGQKTPHTTLGHKQSRHWWLTIFKMGVFSSPERLFVNTAIRFRDYSMLRRFVESFEQTLPGTVYQVNGTTVYFTFYHSRRKYSLLQRTVRRVGLFSCRLYCKWFRHITRAFTASGDKILYIYYYLPFVIRRLFKVRKQKKHKK